MSTAEGETIPASGTVEVLRLGDRPSDPPASVEGLASRGERLSVRAEDDFTRALDLVSTAEVDCVVAVHRTDGFDGLSFLESVRRERPSFPVVLVPVDGGDEVAARAVAADVSAYVPPGEDVDRRVVEGIDAAIPDFPADSGEVRMPIKDRIPAEERRLKERAMDEAPVGITIADATRPDEPLVYVNDAFEEMTGYEKERALGVNCRFLQGEGTDPEKTERLRTAIDEGEPATVEMRNYRSDGTVFWNRLELTPIRDGNGDVTSYVGFQTDVTERKRAQRQLEREREDLRRVLDRIDGLFSDVTEVVVRAENPAEIHRMIVDRIADGPEFADAWIGEFDPAGDRVTIAEWSGDADALVDREVSLDSDLTFPRVVASAIEEQQPQVLDRMELAESPVTLPEEGYDDCVVVPLTYRSTCYGVLTVYANQDGIVDDREVRVLGAVGRSIGAAINDVLSKRTMTTDSVIEIGVELRDEDLPLVELSRSIGTALHHEGTHLRTDGELLLLFSAEDVEGEAVAEAARSLPAVETAEALVSDEEGTVVQLSVPDSPLVGTLAEYGARIEQFRVDGSVQEVRFRVADEQNGRAVIDHLEQQYDRVELIAYRESEAPERTQQGFKAMMENRLTERQRTALQKAYVSGFFEWPRRCDGDELAESMDIVPSTFHQHLRAAERKLTAAFFDD